VTTDNAHDEEPLAWCPGCGDRIPTEVIRERGVCSNCYGTSDDPWATDQALAEAWAEGHRTGWEHCQDGNYGNDHWDDPTPNPYAVAARPSVTDQALAEADRRYIESPLAPENEALADAFIEGAEWAAARAGGCGHGAGRRSR